MPLTMQAFYNRLFSAQATQGEFLVGLARLTQANRAQMAALNVDWITW